MELIGDSWAIPMVTQGSRRRDQTQFMASQAINTTRYSYRSLFNTSSMGFTKNSTLPPNNRIGRNMFYLRSETSPKITAK